MNSSQWAALGTGLQSVGLSLMVGGMLAIGAFVAPVVFKHFPRHEAGAALTVVFMRYDILLLVALGLTLAGEACRFLSQQFLWQTPVGYVRYALMGVLAILLLVSTQQVNPSIDRLQRQGVQPDASLAGIEFAKTHKLSESLYKMEMLAALCILVLTPWVSQKQ